MENSNNVNLEYLIQEATEIRELIVRDPIVPGFISLPSFSISDLPRYERWKNMTLRYLEANYNGDRCIEDFENKIKEFSKYYDPSDFDGIIGLLESCLVIPSLPVKEVADKVDKSMHINITQQQTQSQEQNQSISLFLEAIKDEITGKQLKELKTIINDEPDPEKAKPKIIDKIKSWGINITSSIIANIITNPSIWNGLG